jgi:hypothetical protein
MLLTTLDKHKQVCEGLQHSPTSSSMTAYIDSLSLPGLYADFLMVEFSISRLLG